MGSIPSSLRRLALERVTAAVLVGSALFACSYAINLVLSRLHTTRANTIFDDVAIGVLGALAAYAWARFEAERQARARGKLVLVAELNHHIRNGLTLIRHSTALKDEQNKVRMIDEAVERIDRVLTELVPTADSAESPRLFLDAKN